MKKLIIPFLAAAAFAVAGVAQAAGPTTASKAPPTNVVTRVNIQLTYTSQLTNITTFGTNITKHIVGKTITYTTNLFETINDKAVSTPIGTADVIKAIRPDAPKGAYLAHVSSTNNPDYFAIRVGDTNFYVLTNEITTSNILSVRNGKATVSLGSDNEKIAPGSVESSLQEIVLTTGTLTFDVSALGLQNYLGAALTLDGFSFQISDQKFTVLGTGADAVGANEIVTGTITANGTTLGH